MDFIGIDVHKKESQVCILAAEREVLEKRIRTERERFAELLKERPRARILMESSTESEWVARCLEGLGHEVVVADPNFAPMYATRSRRVKTDKRDARTLAEACKLGAYKPAHRTSDARRHLRARLAVREALMRTRTRYIRLMRALVRREGFHVGNGGAEAFPKRLEAMALPEHLKVEVEPLLRLMEPLNEQIAALNEALEQVAKQDEAVANLCTTPQVGPVTASAFVAAVDTPERFDNAHQVEAYFGLVPSERSSGEQQRKGRITKVGQFPSALAAGAGRWFAHESAHAGHCPPARVGGTHCQPTRKRTAVVALARKLAGILFAMMRDKAAFTPPMVKPRGSSRMRRKH